MTGPCNLTESFVDANVSIQPGAYILVNVNNVAVYMGRSDSDLNSRLKDHMPSQETNISIKRTGPTSFYFKNTQFAKDAYILECNWYHKYNPTCNISHPAKNSCDWFCPVCGL
ncbi:MAG: GIY-YIG nuclease family protein [Candidatus Omnitrophica bacterium]|nr:GIY-YIG nuclease family protein [Candidatus Omnitrophota bacterium]